jgi:hypothetical protein
VLLLLLEELGGEPDPLLLQLLHGPVDYVHSCLLLLLLGTAAHRDRPPNRCCGGYPCSEVTLGRVSAAAAGAAGGSGGAKYIAVMACGSQFLFLQ